MGVRYMLHTGHLSGLQSTLRRAVGQYSRSNAFLYVGVTTCPPIRWSHAVGGHKTRGMDEMVLMYQTTSRDYAIEAERALIAHGRLQYAFRLLNKAPGGEGVRYDRPHYYVYVAVWNFPPEASEEQVLQALVAKMVMSLSE